MHLHPCHFFLTSKPTVIFKLCIFAITVSLSNQVLSGDIYFYGGSNQTEFNGAPPGSCDVPPIIGNTLAEAGNRFLAKTNEITGSACFSQCRNPSSAVGINPANNSYTFRSNCTGSLYSIQFITLTNPRQEPCNSLEGNPCNPSTGQKIQFEVDYTSPTLTFSRIYNSAALNRATEDILGRKWRHNYDNRLYLIEDPGVNPTPDILGRFALLWRSNGQMFQFTYDEIEDEWLADPNLTGKLIELKDEQGNSVGWEYQRGSNVVETYTSSGHLEEISDSNGLVTSLSYGVPTEEGGDGNSYTLDRVIGPFGRTLTLSYNQGGGLDTLTDPAGNIITYHYSSSNNNLIRVSYPDLTPEDLVDNPHRDYKYDDLSFLNHLTGIVDENGDSFATWTYDDEGRVISSEHAGGAERVDLTYNPGGSTTVVDGQGGERVYEFVTEFDVSKPTSITGDKCSNCGNQYAETSYDANGFVNSRTDFNGNITSYVNDAKGLEISRTEAVGTAQQRTIITQWHPDFRLPVKITEPGKETNYTYDIKGRLLSVEEVAL